MNILNTAEKPADGFNPRPKNGYILKKWCRGTYFLPKTHIRNYSFLIFSFDKKYIDQYLIISNRSHI